MIEFALPHDSPCSIRYPKATAESIEGARAPIELGRAEVMEWGHDGMIVACGTLLNELPGGGRHAARRRAGRRRDQCPLRQAAGYRNHFAGRFHDARGS